MCQKVSGRNYFHRNTEKEKGCGGGAKSKIWQRIGGEVGEIWPNEVLVAESRLRRIEEPAGVEGECKN